MTSPKDSEKGSDLEGKASGLEDPPTFPEKDAETLLEYAAWIETIGSIATAGINSGEWLSLADKMLKEIRDILGNYEAARECALGWARASTVPSDIRHDLIDQLGAMHNYWDGNAFGSFVTFMDNVCGELEKIDVAMVEVGKQLADAVLTVHTTYSSAIKFLSDCAGELIAAADVDPWTIADLIGGLLKNVGTLISEAVTTIGDYKTQITKVEIAAISFPTLPDSSATEKVISDPKNWNPAPAP